MGKRKIVLIDEERCNGCGICVPGCHEGAIQIIDGKARLVADNLCDGLGDCLRECPLGAIKIIEREAMDYDEQAVQQQLASLGRKSAPTEPGTALGGCPGARMMDFSRKENPAGEEGFQAKSELAQWPVQLHLVSPSAPYFQKADLLLCADCVPFASAQFHSKLLKGKAVAIACPKLDSTDNYVQKIAAIISENNIKSVTVAHMEVPCCSGLVSLAKDALKLCGSQADFHNLTVTIGGEITGEEKTTLPLGCSSS